MLGVVGHRSQRGIRQFDSVPASDNLDFMNVVLPPDLEKYVESLVEKGDYPQSSAVIEAALRQHQISQPAFKVVMTPRLEKLLDEAMEDLDSAKTTQQLRRAG